MPNVRRPSFQRSIENQDWRHDAAQQGICRPPRSPAPPSPPAPPQRPKALEEWNDPHLRGEQLLRNDIYEQVRFGAESWFAICITHEQLDDETFTEIHMPILKAAKDRAGAACTDDAFTIVMRGSDAQISSLKRRQHAVQMCCDFHA